jgi:hypothetical protein
MTEQPDFKYYVPTPGRPRQPFCPDCKKQGHKVPKKKGQGYCKDHQYARVRRAYEARRRQQDPNYIDPASLANTLVSDIQNGIAAGMPIDLDWIKARYAENGLTPLPDDELRRLFFPNQSENLIDPDEMARMADDLRRSLAAQEDNPYDPVD